MSETKFTKGPWDASNVLLMNDGAKPIMANDPELERKRVCLVDIHAKAKRGQGWQTDCPEREANANLIAAAPEMYEALENCLTEMAKLRSFLAAGEQMYPDDVVGYAAVRDKAGEALIKARGEQP